MDETYILPRLEALCKIMYASAEVFAQYSKRREKYIFGAIYPFGIVKKNVLDKPMTLYLILCKKEGEQDDKERNRRRNG